MAADSESTLTSQPVQSSTNAYQRLLWTSPPTSRSETAVLFLDGELYLERVQAPEVVQQFRQQRGLPILAAFLSHGDVADRHTDFVCSLDYADFLANDVIAALRREHPHLREFLIAGLSLSGLAAAHIATRHPQLIRAAICQSPSFWWERGRFGAELPAATSASPEFWICVGSRETESGVTHPPSGLRQEWTQIAGCRSVLDSLRANSYTTSYREYDGGHDPECWREDLSLALDWGFRGR